MTRIIVYAIVILILFLLARWRVGQMFYYPDRTVYDTPASHGLRFEEVTFTSGDGTKLSGWFIPAVGAAKGTVIHFHGNAENMTSHFGFVFWLPERGYNLFVFDYRGYGKSAGRPNKRGVYEDSLAALAWVRGRKDIDQSRLYLLGQSLGGTQAILVAANADKTGIRAVVSDSTFASCRAIVRDTIGRMPLFAWFRGPLSRLLISDDLSAADAVARITPVPLLLIHGTRDEIIPFPHAEELLARAGQPKALWRIEGGDHTEALLAADSPYRNRLTEYFAATADNQPRNK